MLKVPGGFQVPAFQFNAPLGTCVTKLPQSFTHVGVSFLGGGGAKWWFSFWFPFKTCQNRVPSRTASLSFFERTLFILSMAHLETCCPMLPTTWPAFGLAALAGWHCWRSRRGDAPRDPFSSICLSCFYCIFFSCWFQRESITTGHILFFPGVLTKWKFLTRRLGQWRERGAQFAFLLGDSFSELRQPS